MSALVREVLTEHLVAAKASPRFEDFGFIASGRSRQGKLAPVSERHDEALGEALDG